MKLTRNFKNVEILKEKNKQIYIKQQRVWLLPLKWVEAVDR